MSKMRIPYKNVARDLCSKMRNSKVRLQRSVLYTINIVISIYE